jgi:ABC-type oligopeptide transport system substrate-binding subunit
VTAARQGRTRKKLAIRAAALLLLCAFGAFVYLSGPLTDSDASTVLRRGNGAEPESLDPHKSRSIQAADVLRDIGEGLVGYSPHGELIAAAAGKWEVSGDGRQYDFWLRPSARWSNGETVSAGHFVYSFRRLVNPETAAFYAQALSDIENAADIIAGDKAPDSLAVEAPEEFHLRIRLTSAAPYFLGLLTHPSAFPVHPGSVERHGDAFAKAGNLLSNGAYKLDAWAPGSVIDLSRNVHYWNNAGTAIDKVRHFVTPEPQVELNRYRAGELDTTANVPPEAFADLRRVRPDELRLAPYLGVYYYGLNLTRAPFRDKPKLRQALSMAIDREVLSEKITGRGEEPAYSWVPPGVDNYEAIRLPYADMTPEERHAAARRLYKESGYGADNPLEVEIRYNTSDTHQRIALAIQSMWRETLGVETILINEEFQVLLSNMRNMEVTQVFRSSWMGDYNDAHTFLQILQAGNSSNLTGYASEEYDSLMQRAAEQTDLGRRRLYLEEAERVLLSDHPVIPLYFYVSKHLVHPRVRGWGDNVLDYHYSQHLSIADSE